jgi:hypothetical protein
MDLKSLFSIISDVFMMPLLSQILACFCDKCNPIFPMIHPACYFACRVCLTWMCSLLLSRVPLLGRFPAEFVLERGAGAILPKQLIL